MYQTDRPVSDDCPVPCNLCGGTRVEVLAHADREGRPLRTTMCTACGLVWCNPRPDRAAVRRYYEREYRQDYRGHLVPTPQQVLRAGVAAANRYRSIEPWLRGRQSVLDIGAGSGEFVYVLRKLGFDARGIEPDLGYSQYAREVLRVPVQTAFLQDAELTPGSFQAVLAFHSLEHMEDPSGVLARIRDALAPAGTLAVEVPNLESTTHPPAHRFHRAHLYTFSRVTLQALAEQAGFAAEMCTLSEDGGNVLGVFRKSEAAPDWQATIRGNYERSSAALREHTAWRHYASLTPYLRLVRKARRYAAERRFVRRHIDEQAILDEVIAMRIGPVRQYVS